MPWVATTLADWHPKDPYLGFSIVCLLGAYFAYKLKVDTT